jgi:hypothetical protein
VKVEDSQFESSARFLGIEEHYPGYETNYYFLRSFLNKTSGKVTHQLYVSNFYDGSWVIWTNANGEDAQPLEFSSLSREVLSCASSPGCLYTEDFVAVIPDTTLKTHQDGYSVKFYAKTGKEMVITLTPNQIAQQLKAIEDFQASKK